MGTPKKQNFKIKPVLDLLYYQIFLLDCYGLWLSFLAYLKKLDLKFNKCMKVIYHD